MRFMKKKFIGIALTLIMLLTLIPVAAFAGEGEDMLLIAPNPNLGEPLIISALEETKDITIYVTFGMYGELLKAKDGKDIAQLPVELTGKASYNMDDALKAAHESFCENGIEAYDSEMLLGEYVKKFWGDSSGNCCYQLNKGKNEVLGLTAVVNDGDYIDAYVTQSIWPDDENFARFNYDTKIVEADKSFELKLETASFDENFQMVFSPCEDAEILVDGELVEGVKTAADGTFELTLPKGEHLVSARKSKLVNDETVTAITAPVCVVTAKNVVFQDVPVGAYYADAVEWASEIKLTDGIGEGKFGPDLSASRADAVCFLWNLENKPVPSITDNPFTDVSADAYYYDAVLWAYEHKIISGTTPTTFSPDVKLNRAMMTTLLYNYKNQEDITLLYQDAGFADIPLGAYYTAAANWAKATGVVKGSDAGLFLPDTICTRAMIVTLLYRL